VIRRRLGLLVLTALLGLPAASGGAGVVPPRAAEIVDRVHALTAPEMEGRDSATAGGDRAARALAGWLEAAGLRPGGDGGTYLQSFTISTGTALAAGNRLEVGGRGARGFAVEHDWVPHGGSAQGDVEADVAFAGHGVVAPDGSHDDYRTVDVSGKIVLVLEGGPAHIDGGRTTRLDKLVAARQRGARALLIVGERLPPLAETAVQFGLASGTVTPAVAVAILAPGAGVATAPGSPPAAGRGASAPAADPVAAIPATPRLTGTRLRLRVALTLTEQRAANVVGILPGTDPALAGEVVLVGAHYDHLGRVGGAVHPGADDNASGTAVVASLARAFGEAGGTPRTLVFVLFAGEEIGLLGSAHYTSHPVVPLARTVAMVNADMVGRLREGRLTVGGVDSGSGLRETVTTAAAPERLDLVLRGSPHSPSDHLRFYTAGVPVLFFHTGVHDDYHRPSDTAATLNAGGMAGVARVMARTIEGLAGGPRRAYVRLDPPEGRRGGPTGVAFLGVMTDRADPAEGLRLASVLPGSAAARAGIRAGDVIVRLAGRRIDGFEALRTVLRGKHPGDTVDVLYVRDGAPGWAWAILDRHP
jgi:membrane-associated protease RseP (regulator of RpoE activity)